MAPATAGQGGRGEGRHGVVNFQLDHGPFIYANIRCFQLLLPIIFANYNLNHLNHLVLQVLLANSNQLSSLGGLSGLSHLQELSLKDNYLGPALTCFSLPASLLRLHLDSNSIRQLGGAAGTCLPQLGGAAGACLPQLGGAAGACLPQLGGAAGTCLPQLQHLGLAQNELHSLLGASLPLLAPLLSSLDLSGNCLSSLQGLGCLPCLTALDVSRNALTSLEGLQGCTRLIGLDASSNQLSQPGLLPWPSGSSSSSGEADCTWPYQVLQRLNLSQNALSQLGDLPPLPALTELKLQVGSVCGGGGEESLDFLGIMNIVFG